MKGAYCEPHLSHCTRRRRRGARRRTRPCEVGAVADRPICATTTMSTGAVGRRRRRLRERSDSSDGDGWEARPASPGVRRRRGADQRLLWVDKYAPDAAVGDPARREPARAEVARLAGGPVRAREETGRASAMAGARSRWRPDRVGSGRIREIHLSAPQCPPLAAASLCG